MCLLIFSGLEMRKNRVQRRLNLSMHTIYRAKHQVIHRHFLR
jgi:hypothetical protein